MIPHFRQLRDCTSGAALMEAAIVFPLVLTLMLGVIEFGRAFQVYHTADKSMRSATRYLARVPESATCDGAWGQENARNLAVYGTIDPGANPTPIIPDWEPEDIIITFKHRDPECTSDALDDPLVIALDTSVPVPVQLLIALGLPGTTSIEVSHEERHIGG